MRRSSAPDPRPPSPPETEWDSSGTGRNRHTNRHLKCVLEVDLCKNLDQRNGSESSVNLNLIVHILY